MANRDIIAIGTSAGGVHALRFLASELPRDLPASVVVVIHLSAQVRSELDAILTQAGPLRASFAEDGEQLEDGRIYLSPAGSHLLVHEDRLALGHGPRENSARPAIDPLLRSAAVCCGPRAIGVVLTGTLGDGASGLHALAQCGGITVVQDPSDADYPEMPATALGRAKPDHVVSLAAMPALLASLARQPVGAAMPVPDIIRSEVEIARTGRTSASGMDRVGRRSVLTCPDCHGVMWEIDEGSLDHYRCHVGHAYAAELMTLALDDSLARALGSALRALDERVALAQRLQGRAAADGHAWLEANWRDRAQELEQEADVIRSSVRRMEDITRAFHKDGSPLHDFQ